MSSNQSLLTIGAMILLSSLMLRINTNILTTGEVMDQSKFRILATSLASSIIEEASNKAFDQFTDGNSTYDSTMLTMPDSLGNEDEDYVDFNDFDDYNGYTKKVTNLPSAVFNISCIVDYVNPPNLENASITQSWNKKITVLVSSPSSQDTIKLSSIYSYWFFQ